MVGRFGGACAVGAVLLVAGCSGGAGGSSARATIVETLTAGAQPSTTATPSGTSSGTSPATTTAAPTEVPVGARPPGYSASTAAVQRAMLKAGLYTGPIDGVYGEPTAAAVRAFQRAHGLQVDGKAGPAFWAAVNGSVPGAPSSPAAPSPAPTGTAPTAAAPTTGAPAVSCGSYYAQWDAAVQANSRSRSRAIHAKASAAGCAPNTWVPSRTRTTVDTGSTHTKGESCSMAQIGTYDSAGNVCTQDVENHPHWN